jgi:methionyl-tRNA formyltransferase
MRLIFAGTPAIAAQALAHLSRFHEVALVITREDAPVGRKKVMTPSPVAQTATELKIPVVKTSKVAEVLDQVVAAHAELAIVVAFGALIPKAALSALPWWNIHYSLLPSWRGATPLQHSMIFNEGIGISIFELEQGLDTGPILAAKPMEFLPQETSAEALVRFTSEAFELLIQTLNKRPSATEQAGKVSLAPKITRAEARVDFALTADEIASRINALNPEPAAWAQLEGNPIRLLRAKSLGGVDWRSLDSRGEPGLLWLEEGRVLLGCGKGTRLELIEIQPAGKTTMAAIDFMRGQAGSVKLD